MFPDFFLSSLLTMIKTRMNSLMTAIRHSYSLSLTNLGLCIAVHYDHLPRVEKRLSLSSSSFQFSPCLSLIIMSRTPECKRLMSSELMKTNKCSLFSHLIFDVISSIKQQSLVSRLCALIEFAACRTGYRRSRHARRKPRDRALNEWIVINDVETCLD